MFVSIEHALFKTHKSNNEYGILKILLFKPYSKLHGFEYWTRTILRWSLDDFGPLSLVLKKLPQPNNFKNLTKN